MTALYGVNELINLIIRVWHYFLDDPMRILALIGGSGGLVYWYDRYKNRTRLRVRLLDLGLYPKHGNTESCIRFEAENFGTVPISLEPIVYLSGIIPQVMRREPEKKLKRCAYSYEIRSSDRSLPPHVPKTFEAYCTADDMQPFLWFMTYTFKPTRGKVKKIRIRSADNFQLCFARYIWELAAYFVADKLKIDK